MSREKNLVSLKIRRDGFEKHVKIERLGIQIVVESNLGLWYIQKLS
jgi:hypothetical protein